MKFGRFDDIKKEYVINTPYTPYPWINYHGNTNYFSLFSNTAGGYSFYKDARLRRITRYRYNNVPVDNEGKYFYIVDGKSVWNPGVKPTKTLVDRYECRHGLGYTIIETSKNQLSAKQTSFVPLDYNGEIHMISLKNESSVKKEVSLHSYVEFCLWDAHDDMTNFQRNYNIGEVEVEKSTIFHKTEYRERRNHFSFYHVNQDLVGYDTDRESFIGLYNSVANPEVVVDNQSKNSVADGWSPIAAHNVKIELQPQEEKDVIFILGYVENDEEKFVGPNVINKRIAYDMIEKYQDAKQVESALKELSVYWENILDKFQINTKEEKLNRMVNIWNAYQNMTCFNMSRSASYFESGVGRGMGFRDSNQDVLGFVHIEPKRAKERLKDLISTQLVSGSAYHQYSPLTKKGNEGLGTGFNDDPCWMVLSVAAYIKETGDIAFLDEEVPYENDLSNMDTILGHVKRAISYTLNNLGPHRLPLIGRADWNDCLNLNCFSEEPGESFQTVQNKGDGLTAESIFIAGLFVYATKEFMPLLDKINDPYAVELTERIAEMETTVLEHGYDENWFLRAYDAFGNKVGSNENDEGKIFIEPQGMCVMAGIGIESGQADKALDSSLELLDSKYGMVLNYPAYNQYQLHLGEISSYPNGYKENGGIFCHNNPWMMIAFTKLNRRLEAFDLYKKIAPAYLEDISDIHRTEPYVYSQMIAGKEAKRHGEAKNSWLTGTSSWNYVAITQFILGVKPELDGLSVNPKLPADFKEFTISRKYRGITYEVSVENGNRNTPIIELEGQILESNIIPFKEEHVGNTIQILCKL